ncbi:probable peroxisomal acyl-coenzyme A oxidase 1 [Hyposmocoma kahamanoa]|uniref:probable peroxisomal acyl-coenzyme A oxidase 1 n=1 Tax=Hyposmocoma kahamanoa TaxID=1477025 RepID=UPI000E6D8233|nr:probable peroxisomal acyl-coenzyme A oxidase 1 [Hyposmocoma kahamanoa]
MMVKINEDLQRERNKCNFNVEELTNFIDGGVHETEKRRKIEQKILNTEGILDTIPEEYLSHKEKYENAVRKNVLFLKAMKELEDPNVSQLENAKALFRSTVGAAVFKDGSPLSLHYSMFIPTLNGQANEEQKKYWLKKAVNWEIIGTYAQTELGHGTFLRGLETTATYDPNTEEFILHSPTLTSHKWWPGGLAHTANYCVVMAQLYTKGKHCGMQPFIVQIRDDETHMPLPGIKVGEIGAKLGFNTVNNGFLGFNNHRIPRNQMLMRFAQVLKDGTFKMSPNSKLTYGTMVFVRVLIVNSMASLLAKAATVAIRYSAVRRQSQPKPGSLYKAWNEALKGKPLSPIMAYLTDKTPMKRWDGSVEGIVRAFQKVARGKIETCAANIDKYRKRGLSPEDAWNSTSVQFVAATEAHCRAFVLKTYKEEIDRNTATMSATLKKVLNQLNEMYCVYWALEKVGDLLLYTAISGPDVQELQKRYEDLLENIRPNAVGLVDAFDFRDEVKLNLV